MSTLGIGIGLFVVFALCGLSHWIGRKAQAAEDFDALATMLRPAAEPAQAESDHYGVP